MPNNTLTPVPIPIADPSEIVVFESEYDSRIQKTIDLANELLASIEAEQAAKLLRETNPLRLTGIAMTVPYEVGWESVSLPKSDLKRNLDLVALFRLPKVDGDLYDCEVRVTHNPAKRQETFGPVLEKWERKVRNADGTRIPRTSPTIVDRPFSVGTLRVGVTDLFGTVTTVSDGYSVTRPNHRFIGVILSHYKGPHYVTIVGPVTSMAKWEETIFEFVKSAKLTP